MASDLFRSLLIHQATVQRISSEPQDSIGEPEPVWADNEIVDCRFIEKRESIANESVGFLMQEIFLMLVDTGTDVLVDDRITDVTTKSTGASVDTGPFLIHAVLQRNTRVGHHISLNLEKIE